MSNNNKPPGQHKAVKDQQLALVHHEQLVKSIVDTLKGKLSLIGINSQGAIERSFITDVKSMYIGAVAVRMSAENTDTGMYFDFRGLTVYHTYDEMETGKFVEENAAQKKIV